MKTSKYYESYESFSGSFTNSVGSRKSKKKNNATRNSKQSSKRRVFQVDNSKVITEGQKFDQKIKSKIYCSSCRNLIMKSGINFSCKHIICHSCLSREILQIGLNNIQNKLIENVVTIPCPCKEGEVEIALQDLISILYVDPACIKHSEKGSCPKCIIWSSLLTNIKKCDKHSNITDKNTEILFYCDDCQKELCSLCKDESHNGHKIRLIKDIVSEIKNIKLKCENYKEFSDFIELVENKFYKEYNTELEKNMNRLEESINILNKIKIDFLDKMHKKFNQAKNFFTIIKYVYYYYYKDLVTVQNDINVIDFLFQNKYEIQNISFIPKRNFSSNLLNINELLKKLKIETFDSDLNIKNNLSKKIHEIYPAHDGYIFSLLNLGNEYLLSSGEDKKIKVWSLNNYKQIINEDLVHNSSIFSLCKTNDEKKFFSGSYGEIKIWNSADFKLINTLYGHSDYICYLKVVEKYIGAKNINNIKEFLCSASYDKTIKIWNIESGNCLYNLIGHTDQVNCILQTEIDFIISCSSDKSIKFWDIEKQKCYLSLDDAHDSAIYSMINLDNKKLASSSYGKIKIFDLNLHKCDTIYSENNVGVYSMFALPDNKLVSSSFKRINFWDLNKNQWLYSIEGHKNYITCLLIVGNNRLFSAGDDGSIIVWE